MKLPVNAGSFLPDQVVLTSRTQLASVVHSRGALYSHLTLLGGGGKYQPMSFGGKNKKRPREKGGKCGRKGKKGEERGKKKEERGKKIRKEGAKGKNKCKIGKN
jgi:hypothetical protein